MTDKLYEALGRKQLALEEQDKEYTNLLTAFHAVVTGQIPVDNVSVDIVNRTWEIKDLEKH